MLLKIPWHLLPVIDVHADVGCFLFNIRIFSDFMKQFFAAKLINYVQYYFSGKSKNLFFVKCKYISLCNK
jgi:hypothetical protein